MAANREWSMRHVSSSIPLLKVPVLMDTPSVLEDVSANISIETRDCPFKIYSTRRAVWEMAVDEESKHVWFKSESVNPPNEPVPVEHVIAAAECGPFWIKTWKSSVDSAHCNQHVDSETVFYAELVCDHTSLFTVYQVVNKSSLQAASVESDVWNHTVSNLFREVLFSGTPLLQEMRPSIKAWRDRCWLGESTEFRDRCYTVTTDREEIYTQRRREGKTLGEINAELERQGFSEITEGAGLLCLPTKQHKLLWELNSARKFLKEE